MTLMSYPLRTGKFVVEPSVEKAVWTRGLLLGLTVAGALLLLSSVAWAGFTGGPSVRVSPNTSFDIRWIASFVGTGTVEIFTDPKGPGAGNPIDTKITSGSGNDHTVSFAIGGLLNADTTYYFRITHKDPTGGNDDLTNDPVPPATDLPPVFTGAQVIENLIATPGIESADVAWDANVIGYGSVVYGIGALDQGPVTDKQLLPASNIPNHAFALSGLQAGATYQFKVSNHHAIDDLTLAETSGQFTTPAPPPGPSPTSVNLVQPHAEPRAIDPGHVSTLSIRATDDTGAGVPNVVVQFSIDPSSQGSGSLGGAQSAQATTNANGIASVSFTAGTRGNVHVDVTSASANNSHKITVVVKRV